MGPGARENSKLCGRMLKSAWRYRHFILSAIKADIRGRFANSRIGGVWLFVQPLVQVAIFATVLTSVLSSRLPGVDNKYAYVVYLLAGTSAWSLFSETLSRCINVFVDQAGLLKKIAFPRICLPLVVIGGAMVNFLVLLSITIAFLLVIGAFPGVAILWVFPLSIIVIGLAAGLGIFLGVLNVFMRDIGQAAGVFLNLWFWVTPIVYPVNIVPQSIAHLFHLNPMLPVIVGFHDIFLAGESPNWIELAPVTIFAVGSLALAYAVFKRAGPDMVDVL